MPEECHYNGSIFIDGSNICSDGISFNCRNSSWFAQGATCNDIDTIVNPNVEAPDEDSTSKNIGNLEPSGDNLSLYNGRTYSEGAVIHLDGTIFRASFGQWLASGSVPN
jgi:hypothetical protein